MTAKSGARRPAARPAVLLAVVALAAGLWFFTSLDRLWPLAPTDLSAPHAPLVERAVGLLEERGFDVDGFEAAVTLRVDPALEWVDRSFGRDAVERHLAAGDALVLYRIELKRRGEAVEYTVDLPPGDSAVAGFAQRIEDDAPGAQIDRDAARALAEHVIRDVLGVDLEGGAYRARHAATVERPNRRDHDFGWERLVSTDPELRRLVRATVAGDVVLAARRGFEVPAAATRAARTAAAPGVALETVGAIALAATVLAAFWMFLRELRAGNVDLRRAAFWPIIVLVGMTATRVLDTGRLFHAWDPLWPRWVAAFRFLAEQSVLTVGVLLVLFTVVGAGDALDRRPGVRSRGASLWLLARGRVFEPSVGLASARGFLVGLLCGGAMVAGVWLLDVAVGARTDVQPQGFFFYTLNSAAPLVTSLCFFSGVALTEELGYRYFGGLWFASWTRRRWQAVLLPALIYGLTHTRLEFLPPAEPWWGRAFVLTAVGCVWGWAFFRFDALTVVLSHFTADLFIFNWPLLQSGRASTVVAAVATVSLPLVPAVLAAVWTWRRRHKTGRATGREPSSA